MVWTSGCISTCIDSASHCPSRTNTPLSLLHIRRIPNKAIGPMTTRQASCYIDTTSHEPYCAIIMLSILCHHHVIRSPGHRSLCTHLVCFFSLCLCLVVLGLFRFLPLPSSCIRVGAVRRPQWTPILGATEVPVLPTQRRTVPAPKHTKAMYSTSASPSLHWRHRHGSLSEAHRHDRPRICRRAVPKTRFFLHPARPGSRRGSLDVRASARIGTASALSVEMIGRAARALPRNASPFCSQGHIAHR